MSLGQAITEAIVTKAPKVSRSAVERVSVDLHYRSPHHMLGDEGFSLVSNDYLANVLAKSVAARVVSPRQCAIMLFMIGRQQESLVGMNQQSIADALTIPRSTVSTELTGLSALNWVRKVRRGVYQVNPLLANMGNGNAQRTTLADARALALESGFPDEVCVPEMPAPRSRKRSTT
ncbi:replication/maintenance protein RepL [Streptomyces sp. SID3343]|uniref:replication/maintenance protein RepL n=1 Tax=Streptomyces sp. SID3343 TaxID=2690260 RepID=UPI0013712480|nr:replication/maintenance protein RepL [Streptomyces sp. SID3343]